MANKKRLIDADALWRKFESEPWYDNADRDEIALPLVDDAPTVDAVEVVRCKDCAKDGLFTCPMCYIESHKLIFINHDPEFFRGGGDPQ